MITASQYVGGNTGDELAAPLAGEVLAGGGQHARLWVDLQPLRARTA